MGWLGSDNAGAQAPKESCRLPSAGSEQQKVQLLMGMQRFKLQSYHGPAKLESFDRKFGQAANTVAAVGHLCL